MCLVIKIIIIKNIIPIQKEVEQNDFQHIPMMLKNFNFM